MRVNTLKQSQCKTQRHIHWEWTQCESHCKTRRQQTQRSENTAAVTLQDRHHTLWERTWLYSSSHHETQTSYSTGANMVVLVITLQDTKTANTKEWRHCSSHTARHKDIILRGSEHITVATLQDTKTSHTSSTNTVPERKTQQRAAVQEGDRLGWRQGSAEVAPPRYRQWRRCALWRTGPGRYTARVLSWQQQAYIE